MSEDEEDPVVDEIPVYLTHDLCDNLFVYQFPVHPAASSGNLKVVKSRIKPENQEVVLEMGLDTSSVNFDKSHGELIAANVDKDKHSSQRTYPTKIMDRLRLDSSRALIDRDSYAVGTMCNGELVISPIRGVVSLAPSFSHISNVEEEPEEEEEEAAAKVVRVQFPRAESDRAKKAREASYTHFMEKTGVEPWFNTQFHDVDSAIAKLERTRLTSGFSRGGKPLDLTSENYLDALLPKETDLGSTRAPSLPDHLTSIAQLRELPLKDQVHRILEQVRTVTATQLGWLLGCDKSKILDCLQTCAVLVQGNWVLRSDLLYKNCVNGIPAAVIANARDFILHEFHQGKQIERKELANKLGIPPDEIKQIMAHLAVLRQNKLWHFRLPPDEEFIAEYTEIVDQQNLLWEARMRDINEQISVTTNPPQRSPGDARNLKHRRLLLTLKGRSR
uniref:DNA-directed RNA polymerase III subunit RPC5 n=1 Tax=Lygus hesperus TaxID=30085 RepID=A0A0A9ZCC8_LYGHE